MSAILAVKRRTRGKCLQLSCVDWQTYTRLLRLFAERRDVRLTYDRGELEIMTPSLEHDNPVWFLGMLIFALADELGLPLRGGGSTTMRRRLKKRGIEADACFWIANAPRMAGRRRLNLRRDPPPDLGIEVEVTHGSLDRLGIYAALMVPEVWWVKDDRLTIYVLRDDGEFRVSTTSRSFPIVTSADLLPFLHQGRDATDPLAVIRRFRLWIRKRRGKK